MSAMMNERMVQAISDEVHRRFPDLKGKKPKVQPLRLSEGRSISKVSTYLLIYQGQATTSTRKVLPYSVRVVANEKGEILKISMSH